LKSEILATIDWPEIHAGMPADEPEGRKRDPSPWPQARFPTSLRWTLTPSAQPTITRSVLFTVLRLSWMWHWCRCKLKIKNFNIFVKWWYFTLTISKHFTYNKYSSGHWVTKFPATRIRSWWFSLPLDCQPVRSAKAHVCRRNTLHSKTAVDEPWLSQLHWQLHRTAPALFPGCGCGYRILVGSAG
jgi:hypothetical protein